MIKYLFGLNALVLATSAVAHAPFITPQAFVTDNAQIPVLTSYAEQTLHPEYAVKTLKNIQIAQPNKEQIEAEVTQLKSTSISDLVLKDKGTYTIATTIDYPLTYAQLNKEWRIFNAKMTENTKPLAERTFYIASDFKKAPELVEVKRYWTVESYVSKSEFTPIQVIQNQVLNTTLSVHPNQIKAGQAVIFHTTKSGKPLAKAQVEVAQKGAMHGDELEYTTSDLGQVSITFPKAGEYTVTIQEAFNSKQRPTDQYYHIITLQVLD